MSKDGKLADINANGNTVTTAVNPTVSGNSFLKTKGHRVDQSASVSGDQAGVANGNNSSYGNITANVGTVTYHQNDTCSIL
jgi:hypothetical protein